MSTSIVIALCILLLFAYVFDISASKTKIPSVILLLLLGYLVRQATVFFEITLPNLAAILPALGTIGLILIVLEGALELELNYSKLRFVGKAALMALLPMIMLSIGLALLFQQFADVSLQVALANAIPLAVISSSVAIPSAKNLNNRDREFVTYESSLSDIFGVLSFNFVTVNESINTGSVSRFTLDILIMLAVTFITAVGLSYLLSKIRHPVKYLPIVVLVVLIYFVSKIYHLPALIFILLFGIFLGNLEEFKRIGFIRRMHPEALDNEVHRFRELSTELAFLIRAIFFLVFGFLIETNELLNTETIFWSLGICAGILIVRFIFLKILRLNGMPLLFMAPRGLISILLFLSIPAVQTMDLVDKSLIIQVIIFMAIAMMIGIMLNKKKTEEVEHPHNLTPNISTVETDPSIS